MRRRGAVPRAAMTVRHCAAGMVLVRSRLPAAAPPRSRSWHGLLAFATAAIVLAACAALLLTRTSVIAASAHGPCPLRTSTAAYAGGHRLLIRAEPTQGATALLHLCAERAVGPVRSWSVRVEDSGPSAAETVAVQQVAEGVALAAAPLTRGIRTRIDVTVMTSSGTPLTFTTRVTAG